MSSLVAFLVPFDELTLDMHKSTGFFGWMHSNNFIYTFFVMGILCRSMTFTSYNISLKNFSTVVVTNVFMTEPLIS
jgi:drug/metabolite transporter (DMT)-like permease